jgi:hypothetical protein
LNLLSTGKGTAYDKILKFYLNPDKPVKLTEKQMQLKFLYELADRLLMNYSPKQTADMIRARYKKKISRATAYRVVSDALNLFGDIKRTKKEGLKNLLQERQLRLAQKCEKAGDYATAERCYEAIAKMADLNNSDVDLNELYKNLQLPTIVFTTNPDALRQLPEESDIIDITHEQQ